MKKISTGIILITMLYLLGCAPTLPSQSVIRDSYFIDDVKTFSSVLDCENTQVTEIRSDFAQDYCQILEGNIKLALQKENPNFKYDENNPELLVHTTLEEIHGGNAAARFWVGFGAGRSITTVYVKVFKNNENIAERRITETTTLTNIATNNYANEDAILQDAPLVARKIGKFVNDPIQFEKDQAPPDDER